MTQKISILALTLIILLPGLALAASDEPFYAQLDLTDSDDLFTLYELKVNITSRHGSQITVYIDKAKFEQLRKIGFDVNPLPPLPASDDKAYHTYDSHIAALNDIADQYPEIADVTELVATDTGKKVMLLKISDNVGDSEAEPGLLLDFNIHGDEKISAEVAYCFIYELLENYTTDNEIKEIIDNNELFIVPILNPDGFVANRRSNSNFIDLNRNHGFWWTDEGSKPASEKEVQAIMQLAFDENFMFSISYHSGAELVNYPLDSTSMRAPDDALFQHISSVYGTPAGYSITNGWDWYQANGIGEESYYGSNGTLAFLVEISNIKTPNASQIPTYCNKNVPAMKAWAKLTNTGIRGTITDALTGSAVAAKIEIVDDGWPVWSDPVLGDYYRFTMAGTYSVRIEANGYLPELIENVTVTYGESTVVDVQMERDEEPLFAGYKVNIAVTPRPWGNYANETLPFWALSEKDDRAFSLGAYGWIVVDMGQYTPISNIDGADFTIFEDDTDAADQYSVSGSNDWRGPFTAIGTGSGTTQFELPDELDEVRYLRIDDTSGLTPAGARAGADIDAIHYSVTCSAPVADFSANITTGDAPLEVTFQADIEAENECLTGMDWDFGDGQTGDQTPQTHTYTTPGTYSVTLVAYGPGGADTVVKTDFIVVTGDEPVDDDDDNDDDSNDDDDASDRESEDDDDSSSCCG